jgi:threonine synthase
MIRAHGAAVTVFAGTRDETADACREKASREGTFYASHVFNPMFYQGTKTFIYEIFEQLGRIPDHLFIPVGNGTLLLGVELALQELLRAKKIRHLPHVFAVQSERCAPLANTRRVARDIVPMPTLAEGIAIGKPMRAAQILKIIEKNGWDVVTIPEENILPAHDALARGGYFVETTTAATDAAYLETCKKRPFGGDVLIPLTGAGLKSRH